MSKQAQKELIKTALRRELARREFWSFCLYLDREFFTARPFLREVAEAFQEIEEGKIKSLSVSMPPRAGKSYITSLFCAWTLGRNPVESVMRNACTATLYVKFSYDVRAIINSDRFREVFVGIRLSDDKKNLQGWNLTESKQVGYFGAGVGGTIIGFGATKVAITDDLYRGIEDALSDTVNDRIHQWKQSTHDSRFESGCARVDIGTRWSLNDVIGRNTAEEIYDKSIVISALTSEDKSFCEAVMTTEEFLEKRKRTSAEIWSAEYQQEPVDIKGRLFNSLQYIQKDEFLSLLESNKSEVNPEGIEAAIGYIDVADEGKDFTALAVAVLVRGNIYIADYVFTRDNTDVTIPLCAGILNKWKVKFCRVESNSMGAMFGRHLQGLTECKILGVANTVNKITRIIMNSVYVQNEFIFVQNEDNHSTQFIGNVLSFSKEGKNKNDDAPDCIAGLSIFAQSILKINT
jgi:predicted phage terminase large subunit-like protein